MLFFITFCVYVLLGVYVLGMNRRLLLNRLFFALSVSLCLWSLGLTFAVNAGNAASCLMWWRFSALGWCTFCSILLHLMLVLTDSRFARKSFPSSLRIPHQFRSYASFHFSLIPRNRCTALNTPLRLDQLCRGRLMAECLHILFLSSDTLLRSGPLQVGLRQWTASKNRKTRQTPFYSVASGFALDLPWTEQDPLSTCTDHHTCCSSCSCV